MAQTEELMFQNVAYGVKVLDKRTWMGLLVLALLEEIDDDLDELDVLLVKINEATVASDFGIEDRPTLVIFEKG